MEKEFKLWNLLSIYKLPHKIGLKTWEYLLTFNHEKSTKIQMQ